MEKKHLTLRGVFLFISLLTGLAFLYNFIDYQHTLSTGDHGLLLYAAEASLRGELPFRDYHYFYGPLMPYYFGLFILLFGNSIVSVLIGYQFLLLACGLLVYCSLSLFLSPLLSFAGCLWFWVFEKGFFYTYNHIGVTASSLLVLFCVLHYLKNNGTKNLYVALIGCVIAGLIKLNFGASLLLGVILSVFIINVLEKRGADKRFLLFAFLITPSLILILNALFVIGLPLYIIKQCYQYFGNDAAVRNYPSLPTAIAYLANISYQGIIKTWYSEFVCVIVAIIGLTNIYLIKNKKITAFGFKDFLAPIVVSLIFFAVNLHEFLVSGVLFRAFYAYPFVIVVLFLVIGHFARHVPDFIHRTLILCVCFVITFQYYTLVVKTYAHRIPAFYIPFKKARIFVSNRTPWAQTVIETTVYLNENLGKDELFLALPYEPLYYYLTDKKSPTRQLVIFNFLKIPPEQERSIINDIEEKNVNWILVSNRAITEELGLGVFGVHHCPMLATYIDEHFQVVAEFGPWTSKPSWAWTHGTRILKRK